MKQFSKEKPNYDSRILVFYRNAWATAGFYTDSFQEEFFYVDGIYARVDTEEVEYWQDLPHAPQKSKIGE